MKAGAPSATALLVAASVVRRGAAHGLPPIAIAITGRALAAARGSGIATLARHRPGRSLLAIVERLVLPGLAAHHCARKAWLWSRLRRPEVANGPLVWVGVGFDGLGRALHTQTPGAAVIETDHPSTLQQRRAVLGDDAGAMHALALPDGIDALAALCAARPVTLVCEGLLMYLPARDVLRMLGRLAALPWPPRLVFSALDTVRAGGRGFRRPATFVRRWLDRHGEPFRWRARPARVQRCLHAAGYMVTASWDGRDFGEYVLEAEPVAGRKLPPEPGRADARTAVPARTR